MKSSRSLLLPEPAVLAGLVIAFALVLGIVLLSSFSTRAIVDATDRTAHAQQALLAVNQLLSTATEAEAGQRGYLLTHDDKYLAPYRAAAARYPRDLSALRHQLAPHPELAPQLAELATLLDTRFQDLGRTIGLRARYGIASALNVVETDQGERVMDDIRRHLQALERHELDEMATHSAATAGRVRQFQHLSLAAVWVTVALSGLGGWFLLRRVRELEKLVTVCAWTHRVKWQGRWISFEEYLQQRFNLHFTHGISDDAEARMREEIRSLPPVEDEEEWTSEPSRRV